MKSLLLICTSVLILASCNNQPAEAEEKKSQGDSLLEQVIAGHDVAMPKMMKLERLQKQTKAAIDSINKLPAAKQKELADYKIELDSTLKALDHADFAMNEWMQGFKYDSLKNNEAERIKYLQNELEKVNKMKDAVLNGIGKADSLFLKK